MTERFFDVWDKYVIGNKEDFRIGLAQLEEEIRQDERKKTLEFVANHDYMYLTVGRDRVSRRHYWVNAMLKAMQKEQTKGGENE